MPPAAKERLPPSDPRLCLPRETHVSGPDGNEPEVKNHVVGNTPLPISEPNPSPTREPPVEPEDENRNKRQKILHVKHVTDAVSISSESLNDEDDEGEEELLSDTMEEANTDLFSDDVERE